MESELVRVAGGRGIYINVSTFVSYPAGSSAWLTSHVGEFLTAALQVISVLGLDGILDGAGNWVVDAENGTLYQLHLTGGISTEATSTAALVPTGGLSLAPCLGGRGLTASVGRCDAAWHSKGGGWTIGLARVGRAGGIGVLVGGRGFRSISLGQAVARGGADGGDTARMRVVEGSRKRALLVRQKSSRRIVVLAILEREKKRRSAFKGSVSIFR